MQGAGRVHAVHAGCMRGAYELHAVAIQLVHKVAGLGCARLQARVAQDEVPIYVVQLDSGGVAEDVCGSEVG